MFVEKIGGKLQNTIHYKVGPYDRYKWSYHLYKWPKLNG